MTAQEYEQFLHDAEVKLARLKSLYEQWFQGIERTEPVIARKDLDRTIELLKKNMPRNTALRFRTQQLSARYGTYGIYWGRIGRQIEEGTYKRILARVSRTNANSPQAAKRDESGWEIEVDVDEVESASLGVGGSDAFSDGDLDAIFGALTTEEKPKTKPTRSLSPFGFGAGLASKPPGSATPSIASPAMPAARPPAATPAAAMPAAATPAAAAPPAGMPTTVKTSFGKPVDAPSRQPAMEPVTATRPAVAAPVTATMPRPKDAPTPAQPAPSAVARPPVPSAPTPPRPAAPVPSAAAPMVPRPPPPVVARPGPPAPPVPRPLVPAPSAMRPAPQPAQPPPPARSLDEGRMRAIHASYVDARRKNNEGADVRYEALAESVEKMIPKLREKHGGKAIDFEVVVQNGKVGLKPKVDG